MDIQNLYQEVRQELIAIDIPIQDAVLELSDFRTIPGKCVYQDNKYKIQIMRKIASNKNIKLLKKVIAHELLHTIKGCDNHKEEWLNYAHKAESAYNYGLFKGHDINTLFHKELPVVSQFKCLKCGLTFDCRDDSEEVNCSWCNNPMTKI